MLAVQTVLSSHLMGYDARARRLSAEHSTLGSPRLGARVSVRSHETGRLLEFAFVERRDDNEGDVMYWHYRNVANNLDLQIWND